MLIHTVLFDPASPEAEARIVEACAILAGLEIPGMSDFRHGPNRDFEGKSARYTYGFAVKFESREVHLAYEAHPDHVRAGGIMVANSRGGHDGIFVSDLEV
ncbi:Dabb family protein [Roseicyclus sp.]|uniref:Dabb family protein n=1 Tax=Roseicyclus sp. TaxID=1914329 RepID=UPI003FA124D6